MSKTLSSLIAVGMFFLVTGCFKHDANLSSDALSKKDQQTVTDWLISQKTVAPGQVQWLDSLSSALDLPHAEKTVYDDDENFLIVPLKNSSIVTANGTDLHAGQLRLLIITDKTGAALSGKLIAFTGRQGEESVTGLIKHLFTYNPGYNSGFNGTVSVLRMNKTVLFQSVYANGVYTQRKTYEAGSNLEKLGAAKKMIASVVRPADLLCTDWYLVFSDANTGAILDVEYDHTDCTSDGDGGGPTGPNMESIDQWKDAVPAGGQSPRLCYNPPYNISDDGTNYSMELDNLILPLVGPNGVIINAQPGNVCITIPDAGITSSTAIGQFVGAYNMAVQDMINGLNAGTILAKDYRVVAAFKTALQTRLGALVPGATVSFGTGCPGFPVNIAQYC